MEIEEMPAETIPVQQLSVNGKMKLIAHHFEKIMRILELDVDSGSLRDTPARVAKMYVKEIFSGLNPANEPHFTLFENEYNYDEIILERNIPVYSYCEHHFVPIVGKAHIAYIPNGKIAGLSKLNRVVNYFSRRPQVQERLTFDIADFLRTKLGTEDVAVIIEAEHFCIASRGIRDAGTTTITSSYGGRLGTARKSELIQLLKL